MQHERFDELLLDYQAGEMTPERRAEFEQHLAGCEECSEKVILMQALERLPEDLEDLGDHPGTADLVAHVLHPAEGTPEHERIRDHLSDCGECSEVVDWVGKQAASGDAKVVAMPGRPGGRRETWTRFLVAASVLLLLGNVVQIVDRRDAGRGPAGWATAGRPVVLRGGDLAPDGGPDEVAPAAGPLTQVFVKDLRLVNNLDGGEVLTVRVAARSSGVEVLSAEIVYLRPGDPGDDYLALYLPSESLSPGMYDVTVGYPGPGSPIRREFSVPDIP